MEPFMLPASLVLAAVIVLALRGWTTTRLRLPPGPRRVPLLGNVHQLPSMGHQKAFAEWGKRYGMRTEFIAIASMVAEAPHRGCHLRTTVPHANYCGQFYVRRAGASR